MLTKDIIRKSAEILYKMYLSGADITGIFPPFIIKHLDCSFLLELEDRQRERVPPLASLRVWWWFPTCYNRMNSNRCQCPIVLTIVSCTHELNILPIHWFSSKTFGVAIPYPLLSSSPPICVKLQSRWTTCVSTQMRSRWFKIKINIIIFLKRHDGLFLCFFDLT